MYRIIGADQKEYGPVSAEQLRRWVADGRANGDSLIQPEGSTDWRPLASFPELASATTAGPPSLPPLSAPVPAPDTGLAAEFAGGPVGLTTVAISVGEQPETVEDVYEPFLIQIGLLNRTSRGRVATRLAYEHLGVLPRSESHQQRLL